MITRQRCDINVPKNGGFIKGCKDMMKAKVFNCKRCGFNMMKHKENKLIREENKLIRVLILP